MVRPQRPPTALQSIERQAAFLRDSVEIMKRVEIPAPTIAAEKQQV
ncbi:hypothetical protein [Microbulbifer discodermiae]